MIMGLIMLGAVALTQGNLEQMAVTSATKWNIEPALLKSVVKIESDWNPSAYRPEVKIGDASWGLAQVLLSTARSVSGNKNLTVLDLVKADVNLDIAAHYLSQQFNRYGGNIQDTLAAYNAGSVKRESDGSYINQDYVDKGMRWYYFYKAAGVVASSSVGLPLLAVGTVLGIMIFKRGKK